MKKTIFTVLIMVFAVALASSQLVSKKGVPILPEDGEYCLGADAVPFFNYFGNMFNGNNNNNNTVAFNFTAAAPMTIFVKRMVDDDQAVRAKIRIGFASSSLKNMVMEDGATDPTAQVEDKWSHSEMFVQLGYGIEKRRGKSRVQGIYGAEAFLFFMSYSDTYTYGNEMTTTNNYPTTTDWGSFGGWNWNYIVNPPTWGTDNPGQRELKRTSGTGIGIAARAFGGVEYFFAPKMSIGGEFGWSLAFLTIGKGKLTTEGVTASKAEEVEQELGARSVFRIDTDNLPRGFTTLSPVLAGPQGSISLFFYF